MCKCKVYSMLIWYTYILQWITTIALANMSINHSHNCHFFFVVENAISPLCSLNWISHLTSFPPSACPLYSCEELNRNFKLGHCFPDPFTGQGISQQLTFQTRLGWKRHWSQLETEDGWQPSPEWILNEDGVEPKFHVVFTLWLAAWTSGKHVHAHSGSHMAASSLSPALQPLCYWFHLDHLLFAPGAAWANRGDG